MMNGWKAQKWKVQLVVLNLICLFAPVSASLVTFCRNGSACSLWFLSLSVPLSNKAPQQDGGLNGARWCKLASNLESLRLADQNAWSKLDSLQHPWPLSWAMWAMLGFRNVLISNVDIQGSCRCVGRGRAAESSLQPDANDFECLFPFGESP